MKTTKTSEAIGLLMITLILFFAGCSNNQEPATTTTTTETTTTTLPSVGIMLHQGVTVTRITDLAGMSLYTFDSDTKSKSNCNGQCASAWPPLITSDSVLSSVPSDLGSDITTFTRDNGATQVAYKGMPLYYYSGDSNPGDVKGDGIGGLWHLAIIAQPTTTTLMATTTSMATTSSTTTTFVGTAATYYVKIDALGYSPKYMNVHVGDTVVWSSTQTRMTVTSPGDASMRELDSPVLGITQTYSHTFNTIGTYNYYSIPHQQASGTVRVAEKLNIVDSNQATSTGDINSAHGPNETGRSNGTYSLNGY